MLAPLPSPARVRSSRTLFNIDQFSLKVLPVDFVTRFFQVAVVTLKNRTLSPVVHTFIDCVREAARSNSIAARRYQAKGRSGA